MPRRPRSRPGPYPIADEKGKKYNGLTRPMKLTGHLRALINKDAFSHAQCIRFLFKYIQDRKLLDETDKRFFYPDHAMLGVFGYGRLHTFAMAKYIKLQMRPLEPPN